MSRRTAAWLALSLCAFSLALTALSLLLLALNFSHPDAYVYEFWDGDTLVALSFSIIGAIIASRLPANPLGWLFCVAACGAAVDHFCAEYAIYALVAQPGSLPAGEALAWLASWRWLAWLTVLLTIVGALWVALSPGVIGNLGSIRNPLGIEGLPDGYEPVQTVILALLLVAALSTLVLRLRRARGIERQQIKWPAFTAVVAVGGTVLDVSIY